MASLWGPPCSTAALGQPVHAAWLAVPAGVPWSRATHPGLAVSSFVSRLLGQREGEDFSVLSPRAEGFSRDFVLADERRELPVPQGMFARYIRTNGTVWQSKTTGTLFTGE